MEEWAKSEGLEVVKEAFLAPQVICVASGGELSVSENQVAFAVVLSGLREEAAEADGTEGLKPRLTHELGY